jgi:anti-sigma factor RsiW
MSDCSRIDPLVTPFIDGELPGDERDAVQRHLQACPPCHARVAAEQAVHGLITARKPALQLERASDALRTRCQAAARESAAPQSMRDAGASKGSPVVARSRRWTPASIAPRFAPFAVAATLVLIVAAAFLYQLTARSPRLMAAELTADHMKCFALNEVVDARQSAQAVESSMAAGFNWPAHLPLSSDASGLELIGSRPCLYGEGRVAHIMYLHNGQPVSLFMLPRATRAGERDAIVEIFGHEAAIWSAGNRTFVLITSEPRSDVERLESYVRASLR